MEISQEEVEALFDSYLTPRCCKAGNRIKDSSDVICVHTISGTTDSRPAFYTRGSAYFKNIFLYPDPASFKAGIPLMLMKLGWSGERAKYIAGRIVVDPARGSGHAWGAMMRGSVSHLRTRISDKGMDLQGL